MTRTITTAMQTDIAASNATIAHFIQLDTDAGPTYLCTAPGNMTWNSHTWVGLGGALVFGSVDETSDLSGQGTELTLSGVNQTIIALILTHNFRGRDLTIWLAHLSDGAVIADPVNLGTFIQLSDYVIDENRSNEGGTVTVKTRVQSRLASMRRPSAVRTNETSHNDMLARMGLATGDTFFANSLAIKNRIVTWGPFAIGSLDIAAEIKKRIPW